MKIDPVTMDTPADATTEVALTNDIRELAGVAAHIDDFCASRELAPEIAYAVNLAIEEMLSNTISHGYEDDETHRIEVIVRLEETTLVVMIVDDGKTFDPTKAKEADVTMSPEDRELGGLGILLVNRMMDSVEYQRRGGCNVVILTKDASEHVEVSVTGDPQEGVS